MTWTSPWRCPLYEKDARSVPKRPPKSPSKHHVHTRLLHIGRNPAEQYGFVNPAVYRGSTVLFPTVEALGSANPDYVYGRQGTPTIRNLEEAIAELEGGHLTRLAPSGLSAITAAFLGLLEASDHILVSDSVYGPTRRFCDKVLTRMGIEVEYYPPTISGDIASLFKDRTRLVFCESPGSQTFEVQDIPALSEVARKQGAWVIMDNSWATPLFFKPFDHGVDISIQAGTKYIVGHADAMLGVITANKRAAPKIKHIHDHLGLCPGPEDAYLALRGLRTLALRLERHWRSAVDIAHWLKSRPEVARVFYPALEGDPGHALWVRDFEGAAGLFSILLKATSQEALSAFLDGLELFGMGYSWGGYESLVIPFDPSPIRTATNWSQDGPALRFHIGLDDVDDLKADLAQAFGRLNGSK